VLETLGCGVILLDQRNRVAFSNPEADRILAARDGLTLGVNGITAMQPAINDRLQALQRRLVSGQIVHGSQRIRVPRTSGSLEYVVEVFRLGYGVEIPEEFRPVVALFISDAARTGGIDPATFRAHYGLSAAEIELAAELADGVPIAHIAIKRRKSVHTVRSQLKGILRKTQTHRQAELAALLSHVAFSAQVSRRPA
jgi:DNA-binding CsgD family transcriptional regulator